MDAQPHSTNQHLGNLCLCGILLVACLSFCSCQTVSSGTKRPSREEPATLQVANHRPVPGRPVATPGYYPPALPHTGTMSIVPAVQAAPPCPCCGPKKTFAFADDCQPCAPSGACYDGHCDYRPYDEYICDGGDNAPGVEVRRDLSVHGLDQEDTIVHYDTIRGDTEWSVSNKVCLYAPRFAAVRQVTSIELSEQADRLADANKALPAITQNELDIVSDLNQPVQPGIDLSVKQAQSVLDQNKGLTAETTRHLAQAHLDLLPYEQLELIRRGVISNNDKPRLAQVALNAIVWTENKAVQVVIDRKIPLEAAKATELGETVMYDLAGKPRMRICKIADKSEAQPGEIVSFTLRFDNVGDQKVGNVTIIDNLTTRLEYVEDSQECSHKAVFHVAENEGETAILRWEIEDPMRVGEGGIIRFKCRVR